MNRPSHLSKHGCLWLVLVGLLGSACAHREEAQPSTTPAEVAPEAPALFLYEVSRNGAHSYLLGTIHVGFGIDEVLRGQARAKFDKARQLVLEADVTSADPQRLMQAALLPPHEALHRKMDPETWHRLVGKLGPSLPEPALDRLKPWMPATMLGLIDIQEALKATRPAAADSMMDVELMREAQAAAKQVTYLETIEEQIAIFEAIPESEQVAELTRALTNESGAAGKAMIEAFASGDEQALTNAIFDAEQMKAAPGFYEAVLFKRNDRWLPLIADWAAKGDLFVAVGAAHLLGERGIVAQLRRRGFQVERFTP